MVAKEDSTTITIIIYNHKEPIIQEKHKDMHTLLTISSNAIEYNPTTK